MPLSLTANDLLILEGKYGQASERAMRIIVRMAEIMGVAELIDVTQVHIDACGMLTEAGLEFIELLAKEGGKVVVPTTLNIIPLDLKNWQQQGISEDYANKVLRTVKAYLDLNCIPTWTCAPYHGYLAPRFSQQIAWGESNAIVYANSVLGAWTERYADFFDVCVSLTGRTPKFGLHIKENRRGQILFQLVGFQASDFLDSSLYPTLGHLVGKKTGDHVPVIVGIPVQPTCDQLKAFGAASASSGAVGLFHMVGITPEACTINEAFQGKEPQQTIEINPFMLEMARKDLSTLSADNIAIDTVILGCPHFSYQEFGELALTIQRHGAKIHPEVRMIIMTNRNALTLLEDSPYMKIIKGFGAEVVSDTCVFHTPLLSSSTKVIMTNSGKCSYYSPGELNVQVAFGNLNECVESAIRGVVCRGVQPWKRD